VNTYVNVFKTVVGVFVKLQKAAISFVMSVHLRGMTWFPLDGFSLNLLFGCFSKHCWENSSCIKIWQE